MMCASADAGQGVEPPLQPSELVVSVRATLPSLALMLIGVESVTSAVGGAAPWPPPEASCTSRYLPGASVPDSGVITFVALPKLPVPVALAYWMLQPASDTADEPRLNSST